MLFYYFFLYLYIFWGFNTFFLRGWVRGRSKTMQLKILEKKPNIPVSSQANIRNNSLSRGVHDLRKWVFGDGPHRQTDRQTDRHGDSTTESA